MKICVCGCSNFRNPKVFLTKYGWLKAYGWKTILLILVALFLAYNFYKDKLRARRELRVGSINKKI